MAMKDKEDKNEKKGGFAFKTLITGAVFGILAAFAIGAAALVIIGLISSVNLFPQDCVAVIPIEGTLSTESMSPGLFSTGTTGSEEIAKLVEEAEKRDEVKAVVFEVNSGGGSVVGSREIYESIGELDKPKVGYIREIGASGGYYVIADTDYIISSPEALTGSIGVIMVVEEMSGLFKILGINATNIVSGEHKDMGASNRPLTLEEQAILQGIADEVFLGFKQVVLDGRAGKINLEKQAEIFDARIMTGNQAKAYGLVDGVGNRQAAIKKAADLAGMEYEGEPNVCVIAPEKDFWGQMFSAFFGGSGLQGQSGSRIKI